jgi:hypothetical protein
MPGSSSGHLEEGYADFMEMQSCYVAYVSTSWLTCRKLQRV